MEENNKTNSVRLEADLAILDSPKNALTKSTIAFRSGDAVRFDVVLLNNGSLTDCSNFTFATFEIFDIGEINEALPRNIKLQVTKSITLENINSSLTDEDAKNGDVHFSINLSSEDTSLNAGVKYIKLCCFDDAGNRFTFASGWIRVEEVFCATLGDVPEKEIRIAEELQKAISVEADKVSKLSSSLEALQTSVSDINNDNSKNASDIEVLRGGLSLLEHQKANSATTLSGYGIVDAYTKSDVDQKISSARASIDENKSEIVSLQTGLSQANYSISEHSQLLGELTSFDNARNWLHLSSGKFTSTSEFLLGERWSIVFAQNSLSGFDEYVDADGNSTSSGVNGAVSIKGVVLTIGALRIIFKNSNASIYNAITSVASIAVEKSCHLTICYDEGILKLSTDSNSVSVPVELPNFSGLVKISGNGKISNFAIFNFNIDKPNPSPERWTYRNPTFSPLTTEQFEAGESVPASLLSGFKFPDIDQNLGATTGDGWTLGSEGVSYSLNSNGVRTYSNANSGTTVGDWKIGRGVTYIKNHDFTGEDDKPDEVISAIDFSCSSFIGSTSSIGFLYFKNAINLPASKTSLLKVSFWAKNLHQLDLEISVGIRFTNFLSGINAYYNYVVKPNTGWNFYEFTYLKKFIETNNWFGLSVYSPEVDKTIPTLAIANLKVDTYNAELALENYTFRNGSTKIIPDYSGFANDCILSSGNISGDKDNSIARLASLISGTTTTI